MITPPFRASKNHSGELGTRHWLFLTVDRGDWLLSIVHHDPLCIHLHETSTRLPSGAMLAIWEKFLSDLSCSQVQQIHWVCSISFLFKAGRCLLDPFLSHPDVVVVAKDLDCLRRAKDRTHTLTENGMALSFWAERKRKRKKKQVRWIYWWHVGPQSILSRICWNLLELFLKNTNFW